VNNNYTTELSHLTQLRSALLLAANDYARFVIIYGKANVAEFDSWLMTDTATYGASTVDVTAILTSDYGDDFWYIGPDEASKRLHPRTPLYTFQTTSNASAPTTIVWNSSGTFTLT
jgi:hypothetical protein